MPIVRRQRNANIDAAVKPQVFVNLIGQPGIYGTDPIGVPLGADAAEKLRGD